MGPVPCVHCFLVKNSGFSQPPVPCRLAAFLESTACTKFDGIFCLASYSGDCSQPTARNLQSNVETHTPRSKTGTVTKTRPEQQPRTFEPPKSSVGEQIFSPKCDISAERTVHDQNGESVTVFWRVYWEVLESICLVRKD